MKQTTEVVKPQLDSELLEALASVIPAVNQISITIENQVPIIHHTKFAELTGRSTGVIGGWIDCGYLPTVKVGRYQMINLALLTENLKKGVLL